MEKTTNDKARQGIGILIFVVIFIGLASTSLGKEKKHDPEVVVQKNNEIVRGELLRVKNDEIILMSSLNGSGITLKVDDIQKIKIVKKGHFFRGVGLGIVIGGAGGALLGFASGDDIHKKNSWNLFTYTAEEKAQMGALAFGLLGAVTGGDINAIKGIDESVVFEGKTSEEKKRYLEKLNEKSRFPEISPNHH